MLFFSFSNNETTKQESIIEHEEDMPHRRVTIDETNIVTGMNKYQMAIQRQEGNIEDIPPGHG